MADNKNNIDKALEALTGALEIEPTGEEVQLEPDKMQEEANVEITEDGGADINLDPNAPLDTSNIPHDANLAEYIEENELSRFASDLLAEFESDRDSRKDWEDTYIKGLDMLGFKYEDRTQPFEGASGVVHPLLAESVTQFQAQAYKELLPPSGPVRCQVIGLSTPEVEDQAKRVKDFMNYQITDVMTEYDPDMDQLLFYLPLAGSAFKKVYYDGLLKRATAKFVAGEDLVINYMATDLSSADRVTHLIKCSGNDVRKQQLSKFYRDIELPTGNVDTNDVVDKIDELQGTEKNYASGDDEHVILEMHVNADVPGFEDTSGVKLPYVVSIDQYSQEILSIRRNWKQGDPNFAKNDYFVHYKFLPGLGFYGFGLIHMLGGLSRTATSVLRQLIDAGTLANLPAGFKARGMRIRDHDEPLQPGEFRDVDVTGTSIRESLLPLPYKEPSQVLFALLGFCVDAGKSFAAIADMKMGEGNEQNPVGTTLALLERGTKVMSAIHKRLHYAQGVEFNLLARCIKMFLPPEYPYMVKGGNRMIKQADFDDRVDILPVSNPNIFSMSQRVMLAQQQLQMAMANPPLHNLREAYRRVYQALDVDNIDALLKPDPGNPPPKSPATENSEAMRGTEPKAFPQQNHKSHVEAHAEFMFTRPVQINPQLYAMMEAHILQHIAIMAAEQVEQQMQQQTQQLQQQIQQLQQQAAQNPQVQQQIQQLQQQFMTQKEAAISDLEAKLIKDMAAEEQQRSGLEEKDPLVKLKQQEIDLKAAELQQKGEHDQTKILMETAVDAEKLDLEREKMQSTNELGMVKESFGLMKEGQKDTTSEIKENVAALRDKEKNRSNEKIAAMRERAAARKANGKSKTK